MNNEQFDRILHSKLADYRVNPPPEVWDGIEKRKFRRRSPFVWFYALLLLVIPAGIYFLWTDEPSQSQNPVAHHHSASEQPVSTESSSQPHEFNSEAAKQPDFTFDKQEKLSGSQPVKPDLPKQTGKVENTDNASHVHHAVVEPFEIVDLPTATLPLNFLSLLWLDQIKHENPMQVSQLPNPQVTPAPEQPSNLSFLFSAGPLFASKHLASKYNVKGDEKYIRYRQESEMRNSAWAASMLIQIDMSRNYFIRTGINYLSINELIGMRYLKAEVDGITTDTIVGTKNEFTDPVEVLAVSDDQDFKLLADYSLRDKAHYRFLSFPLIAGAQVKFSKFSISGSAGLALNFSSSYEGKILAPDSAYLFSISNQSTSPFNKLIGFTLLGSAGFNYELSSKVSVLLESFYFRQLPDITRTNYRLSQRFSGYGLQAGFVYKL